MNDFFLIATVMLIVMTEVQDQVLEVKQETPPTDPMFPCPVFASCHDPYTARCVEGGRAILNPVTLDCVDVGGSLAVEDVTWTEIKGLYRE
ncbi:MAG: hypothetical protein ACE5G2_00965 [Candidatus Krumholzibacteriia bacterium]